MGRAFWIASMSCLGWVVASCGGSEGTTTAGDSGASNVSAEQACQDAATAICTNTNKCAPFGLGLLYGDVATCVDVANKACSATLKANQTGATPAALASCARDLGAASCSDLLSHNTPASCQAKGGTLADGSVCGDNWQCSSGRCSVGATATCGTCTALSAAGGACTADPDCQNGLFCAGSKCVAPVALGGACDSNHPCLKPNICANASATAQGTCSPPVAPGKACTADADCDSAAGYWCSQQDKTCIKMELAAPGKTCGFITKAQFVFCLGAAGACPLTPGQTTGVCPTLGDPGAMCSADAPCKPGATCVSGLCTISDPASCH